MKRHAACTLFLGFLFLVPVHGQDAALHEKLLQQFPARNVGPANMGGRICDLDVVESNPAVMYIGFATGGVFKTINNGENWVPLFDEQPNTSIGALAVARTNPDIVWVGTGEANPRNSVSWGDGVHKSTDGGKTWKRTGLRDTQHIGRVVIHPSNPDTVYVAALGHVWGPNKERGVFKTTDGGKTWQHSLALDENTGCIDVAMDPSEPDILYAAAYAVRRDAFSAGNPVKQYGPAAGLYKTTDGGQSWKRMTAGLPRGQYGRCGLAVYRKNPNVVYAVVQTEKTPVTVQGQSANLNTNLEAGGIFRSDDKGKTWKYLNSLCPRPFYYGQIRIDPGDDRNIYVLGIQFHFSNDGGRLFRSGAKGVHPDHHALWINPRDSRHLVLGNDGGLYFSQNQGNTWEAIRGFAVGQFYQVGVDMRKPYRIYGGLQDNGSWGGPSATTSEAGITLADWKRVGGGDGFYCQVDPTDPNTVYYELQYGRPSRLDLRTGKSKFIQPKLANVRWNWSTPLMISVHNPKRIYYAGNVVFRSEDRGDTWKRISPDLTRGASGQTVANTIFALAESPKQAGILYAGSDDGKLHVTRDGGDTWTDLSDVLPTMSRDRTITRIECSHHDEGTAYVTVGRHRNDDRKPYVFKTTDYGATWNSIANNLPQEGSLHVIRESSRNKNLLFVGTEFALVASLDGGGTWHRMKSGLPTVPVHDLVIHPRDRELVVGTHGRSVYVIDIAPLEEMTPKTLSSDVHLFDIRAARLFTPRKADPAAQTKSYVAPNPPFGATIVYHLKTAAAATSLTVIDKAGKTVANLPAEKEAGLHRVVWNLRRGDKAALVPAGDYAVHLEVGGQKWTKTLKVEAAE